MASVRAVKTNETSVGSVKSSATMGAMKTSATVSATKTGKSMGSVISTVSRMSSMFKDTSAMRKAELDEAWEVGGSYEVQQNRLVLWPTAELCGTPLATLTRFDEFTLLDLVEDSDLSFGFVLPRSTTEVLTPGWVRLEDRTHPEGLQPVLKCKHIEKSWCIKGRYQLLHKATVRDDKAMASEVVGNLEAESEVLVIDIYFNDDDEDELPRLRMKIASDVGIIGWITAITTKDEVLVDTRNLLAPDMVELRKSHRRRKTTLFGSVLVGMTKSYESSTAKNGSRRWFPGGEYYVLQDAKLSEMPKESVASLGQIRSGEVVKVISLAISKEARRPMAFVSVAPDHNLRGWVFLQSVGNFDIIDTRDLAEYDKVQAYLSQQAGDENDDESEDSEDSDESGSEQAQEAEEQEAVGENKEPQQPSGEESKTIVNHSALPDVGPEDIKVALDDKADAMKVVVSKSRSSKSSRAPKVACAASINMNGKPVGAVIGQPCFVGCFKPLM